ncbi:MAG: 30S ribosomal protein S6 [Candidatus Caldatribacteriota bacterium]|nr:30S ribosomal protein S6 [Atribacterota bacterium]
MRNYELMLLLNPNLQEEETSALLEKIQQTITTNQGKIIKVDQWGKKTLAYEIKKFQEAIYVIIDFELDPENIAVLERSIKFEEKIIRYLIVLGQEKVLPKKEQKDLKE